MSTSNNKTGAKPLSKNKSAGSTTQSCPANQNKTVPCDVEDLELVFTDSSGALHKAVANDSRTVRENALQPKDLPYLKDSKYIKVGLYDAVLEVIAPALSTDATEVKKATVAANVNKPIGVCPKSEHPKIVMRNPRYEDNDGLKSSQSWTLQSVMPMDIYGRAMKVDDHVGKFYLRDVFYFFEDSRSPSHIKEITVEANACGVRDDGKKPNKRLKGLIRVYREDKYTLEVSIPSVVSKNASFKDERNVKGERTTTQARWAGGPTETSKYGRNGDMTEYAESDAGLFYEENATLDGNINEIDRQKDLKLSEFAKLTRNGRQLGGLDTINNIIKTRKTIIDGFSFIDELKKAVPQVGFGWSFKLDVLAGTIAGEWGIEAGSNHDTAEYKWVEPYGQINMAMSLLKMELAAFFGVECTSPAILNWFKRPAWEVVAKVELKIGLDCRIEKKIKLVGKDGANKVNKIGKEGSNNPDDMEKVLWINNFNSTGEIYAQFKVTVTGYGMDAKAGVAASMSAEFTIVKPFKVRAKGKRNEAYLYAYFTHFKRKKSPPWKKTLCREKVILKERYIIG